MGSVSVFCEDLRTANEAFVRILKSGYTKSSTSNPPSPDVYEQLIGIVEDTNEQGLYHIEQRNKFSVGETIEVMKPDGQNIEVTVKRIVDENGKDMDSCPHPKQNLYIDLGIQLDKYDILRLNRIQMRFSKKQIEEFIENNMEDEVMDASKINIADEEEFEKLILAYDYSTRKNSRYMVLEEEPEMVEKDGYRYPALRFVKRRE